MFFYPSLLAAFSVSFLFNKEPHFTAETIDDQINAGLSLAVGDVDGDGRPDILLADKSQLVWYRNGDWKRFVMADDIIQSDNVCIAARDIDGDGKVDVAVSSGAVHYLIRPGDPTRLWSPLKLCHRSSANRISWVKTGDSSYQLVVLPIYGGDGTDNQGRSANIVAYQKPADPTTSWGHRTIWQPMPLASHLDVYDYGDREVFYVCGDSGMMGFSFKDGRWMRNSADWLARGRQISGVRIGSTASRNTHVFAAIEPFCASMATVYTPKLTDSVLVYNKIGRIVIDRQINEGRGLGMADFLDLKRDQVVVGWRKPNANGHFGIKLYVPFNHYWEAMDVYWIDRGGIACEGLQIADMDGDGKPDIIAFGRSTHNLKIYWNQSK
ncbi:VCBS repeat-containing protein [Parapedobacter sp. ISTM3]|uniref:FG-GAP repeat domain-containing protein n=1 Tax=Parapedobacter sp. ISTM3 TaxID=2800130 RepID=UPI001907189F|nr:VCBS repeat-containing protein [Parapedobacter sp. ISTM3]MBK1440419.1 VCBS repeat-containing protein [Parapedobacter sp. ISTM3]